MSSEEHETKAPQSKFRVVGFAISDGQKYLVGDFDSLESAEEFAKQHGGVGNPVHVYNDRGELVVRYGSRQ